MAKALDTVGPVLQPGAPAPPDYYRNHLLRVLRFVRTRHVDLLMPVDLGFMLAIDRLGATAQRLFARLIGRKGPLLRLDRIDYAEVPDLDAAIKQLSAAGLVLLDAQASPEVLLGLLTRAELQAQFKAAVGRDGGRAAGTGRASPTKAALIAAILDRWPLPCIRARVREVSPWLAVAGWPSLKLAQLLFFGDSHRNLSVFVLEDLGWVRYEDYPLDGKGRLFANRGELDAYLRARQLKALLHGLDERPGIARPLAKALRECPAPPSRLERKTLNRALNHAGRWFERARAFDEALACYAASTAHPARQRQVRILQRRGEDASAAILLENMLLAPWHPEEADFAERFASGRCRSASPAPTTVIELPAPPDRDLERFAMDLLTDRGGTAWHLENHLPQGLAALAFWDVLFAPAPGAFLHPYQDAPLDLFWDDFAKVRAPAIAARKRQLADAAQFGRILRSTFAAKVGTANQLMSWRHFDGHLLERLLAAVPHRQLLGLACRVIDSPAAARTGFPDLLVVSGDDYEFVEVKGPRDSLQPTQRLWFKFLIGHGFNARVLKFKKASQGGKDGAVPSPRLKAPAAKGRDAGSPASAPALSVGG